MINFYLRNQIVNKKKICLCKNKNKYINKKREKRVLAK
jgi:hypothetical protein